MDIQTKRDTAVVIVSLFVTAAILLIYTILV